MKSSSGLVLKPLAKGVLELLAVSQSPSPQFIVTSIETLASRFDFSKHFYKYLENRLQDTNLIVKMAQLALELNHLFEKPLRPLESLVTNTLIHKPTDSNSMDIESTSPTSASNTDPMNHPLKDSPIVALNTQTLTQHQISSILANAFFCAFDEPFPDVPGLSFESLYSVRDAHILYSKLDCIMHYFNKILSKSLETRNHCKVSFTRITRNEFPNWSDAKSFPLQRVLFAQGTIEDYDPSDSVHLDFCNKYLGGGVLHKGLVQEEILFLIKPECLAGLAFIPVLKDNEAIVIQGAERFSNYSGYSRSFQWTGNYDDPTLINSDGHRKCKILAIDALDQSRAPLNQYSPNLVVRELNKMITGLEQNLSIRTVNDNAPICTGHWGCGAFAGDKELKFLIQWIATSFQGLSMIYFPFGDLDFAKSAQSLVNSVESLQSSTTITTSLLYQWVINYESVKERFPPFQWILMCIKSHLFAGH